MEGISDESGAMFSGRDLDLDYHDCNDRKHCEGTFRVILERGDNAIDCDSDIDIKIKTLRLARTVACLQVVAISYEFLYERGSRNNDSRGDKR